MNRVGKLIRSARIKRGVSQMALARSIGLKSDAQISKIESGREQLAAYRLHRACLILGLGHAELLQAWAADLQTRRQRMGGKRAAER